jgi:hypothetical protein
MSDLELMRLHVEALFTHDASGDLVQANEPRGLPAPRFFLGRTLAGSICRFRHDVDRELREELEAAAAHEIRGEYVLALPLSPLPYETILARRAPVERTWVGPAFSFPDDLPDAVGTTLVTATNAQMLQPSLADWLPDVGVCDPMVVATVDEHAVSVCGSVRRTAAAHEAGVETAVSFRARGYASQVVIAWASAVREMAHVPLYSTSWRNDASRALARKLCLVQFGNDLHVT